MLDYYYWVMVLLDNSNSNSSKGLEVLIGFHGVVTIVMVLLKVSLDFCSLTNLKFVFNLFNLYLNKGLPSPTTTTTSTPIINQHPLPLTTGNYHNRQLS